MWDGIHQCIVPPALGGNAGVLGDIALALMRESVVVS